jgi:hypothetical protein
MEEWKTGSEYMQKYANRNETYANKTMVCKCMQILNTE